MHNKHNFAGFPSWALNSRVLPHIQPRSQPLWIGQKHVPDGAVILLAEDREDDILLIRRAFEKAAIKNPLFVVRNGDEAISYLSGVGKYGLRDEFPLPDLLLLDLKMPGADGFEVLRWLRLQPGLRSLRVVVLTASNEIRDVQKAYQLGANSFMVKPTDFQDTTQMAKTLTDYWLRLSWAPETSRPEKPPPGKTKPNHGGSKTST